MARNPGEAFTSTEEILEHLLAETREYLTPSEMEKIQRAYDLANKAHTGVFRRSGEPYIQHPLEVALLLADMRIDADGIVAALLHDVVEDTQYSLDDLSEQFGPTVTSIVDGVTKFDALAGRPSIRTDGGIHHVRLHQLDDGDGRGAFGEGGFTRGARHIELDERGVLSGPRESRHQQQGDGPDSQFESLPCLHFHCPLFLREGSSQYSRFHIASLRPGLS